MSVVEGLPSQVATATPRSLNVGLGKVPDKDVLVQALRSDPRAVILHSVRLTPVQRATVEGLTDDEVRELVEPVLQPLAEGKQVRITGVTLDDDSSSGGTVAAKQPQQPGGGAGGQQPAGGKKGGKCHITVSFDF